MSGVTLGIVSPTWSPMRHALFQALARSHSVTPHVWFERPTMAHRPGWQIPDNTDYPWEILNSRHVPFSNRLIPLGLPRALAARCPDILMVTCLTQALWALPVRTMLGFKLVLWTGETHHQVQGKPMSRAMYRLRQHLYPRLDGFACYHQSAMDYLETTYDVGQRPVFKLPQCMDIREFISHNHGPRPHSPRVILALGRWVPGKGFRRLLRAWGDLPPNLISRRVLVLAGDGPLSPALKAQAQAIPRANILFPGFIRPPGLPRLYAAAHALVFPTLDDNWGFVVHEALAAGLSVLCAIHAGAREMIIPGKNGLLFDPRSHEDTVKALTDLLTGTPPLSVSTRNSGRLLDKYSPQEASRALIRGLGQVLALPPKVAGHPMGRTESSVHGI